MEKPSSSLCYDIFFRDSTEEEPVKRQKRFQKSCEHSDVFED
jgi:hypothetical protein